MPSVLTSARTDTRGAPPIVLLVEDDNDFREAVSVVLESLGCSTVLATNGEEALVLLRAGLRPGLILLDLMMPVKSGWQFRAEQVRDPELSDIPTVLMSAADPRDGLRDMLHLSKPVSYETLVGVVGHYCGLAC